jgi:excisionase family DNA binding protein
MPNTFCEVFALLREVVMIQKEYLTYEEAAEYIGCKRSTLYSLVSDMGITTHKFKYDKKRYLTRADVERIKEIREKPWLAGPDEERQSEPEDIKDEAA